MHKDPQHPDPQHTYEYPYRLHDHPGHSPAGGPPPAATAPSSAGTPSSATASSSATTPPSAGTPSSAAAPSSAGTPEGERQPAHGRAGRWLHRRDGLVADGIRSVVAFARAKAKGREAVIGIAGAAVAAVLLVAGTSAAVSMSATPSPVVTGSGAPVVDRQVAAQRADRGSRPEPIPTSAPTTPPPAPQPAPDWVNPMPGVPLSSCFGPRWGTVHQGIDFAGDAGTKILSVGAGTVIAAGWVYSGYGISVVVDHGNGFLSHYAHASQTLVEVGQTVKPGQPLALEGTTGDSTGPHLHFEIHQGLWNQVDPAPWLRARGVPVGC